MAKKVKYYYIEEFLNKRIRNGKVEYLIKWKNYSTKWNSWEPEDFLISEPKPKKPRASAVSRKKKKRSTARTTKNSANKIVPPTTTTSDVKTVPRSRKRNSKYTIPATNDTPKEESITTAPQKRSTKKNAEKYYDIEKILAKRIVNDKIQYLVHWKDYHIDESTWEPEDQLKNDYCQLYCESLKHAFLD